MPSYNAAASWKRRIQGFGHRFVMAKAAAPWRQRPLPWTKFTPRLADRITTLLARGESLEAIGGRRGMPRRVTIWAWRRRYPAFGAECERAMQIAREAREDLAIEREFERRMARVRVMEDGAAAGAADATRNQHRSATSRDA